jgi:hypothetical protein
MSWLIWWNSKIDLEKVEIEGTEVSKFVLEERHFSEICAWFAHLIARMSWLIWWNSETDVQEEGGSRNRGLSSFTSSTCTQVSIKKEIE